MSHPSASPFQLPVSRSGALDRSTSARLCATMCRSASGKSLSTRTLGRFPCPSDMEGTRRGRLWPPLRISLEGSRVGASSDRVLRFPHWWVEVEVVQVSVFGAHSFPFSLACIVAHSSISQLMKAWNGACVRLQGSQLVSLGPMSISSIAFLFKTPSSADSRCPSSTFPL